MKGNRITACLRIVSTEYLVTMESLGDKKRVLGDKKRVPGR